MLPVLVFSVTNATQGLEIRVCVCVCVCVCARARAHLSYSPPKLAFVFVISHLTLNVL